MQEFVYPARFSSSNDGGFVVTFRDIPEAITQGESLEHCFEEAAGAVQAAIEGRILSDLEIPKASAPRRGEQMIPVPIQTALKAALYSEMRRAAITRVELARRLGLDEREIRRMLDPSHPSQADRLERALVALGKRAEIRVT
jgi:antitoxin HicB